MEEFEAHLRIWGNNPFEVCRLPQHILPQIAITNKIGRILHFLAKDGWTVEQGESDSGEVSWDAHRSFTAATWDEAAQEAIEAMTKWNPTRWGTFAIEGEEIW